MNAENPIDVLNRLVVLHHRSLAMYLSYASPTWHRGDDRQREVLRTIAAEQEAIVDRLGEMIVDSDGAVQFGGFPMRFTGLHDLSFEFLLGQLLEHQRETIAAVERCLPPLNDSPLAQSLAQDAWESARRHLSLLEEVERPPSPAQT